MTRPTMTRLTTRRARLLGLAVSLLAAGCDGSSRLTVDLATDLVPGREFEALELTLSADPPGANPTELRRMERAVGVGDDFLEGSRAADFEGITPGRYFVRAALRDGEGRVVIDEVREVEVVDAVTTLTIPVTRECVGVECPGSGPPGNLACLAGRCVDPRCSPESAEFCPPVDCEAAEDCTPAGVACADVSCISGTCFVWSGGDACPSRAWCDPDVGCVPEDPGATPVGCDQVFCDVGNECEVGLLTCDGSERCELAANAFLGSPCGRGECDGQGRCVGLPLDLTVEGTGTVVSDPARLACAAGTCRERFDRDSTVRLLALPGQGLELEGWTGDCASVGLEGCDVEMSEARAVTARFRPRVYVVQVTYSGTGVGSVTVETPGEDTVDCESPGCSAQRTHGASVTLTATPGAGSTFAGWGSACASEAGMTCVLPSVESALDVGVSFATEPDLLRVLRTGTGDGRVVSTPAGIDCGAVCAAPFSGDVTLEATPGFGSLFTGWAGAAAPCGSDAVCTVPVSGSVTVEALYERGRYTLDVDPSAGSGSGRVSSMPAGIDCPGSCTASFDGGDAVTLVAVPDADTRVVGWVGAAGCGASPTCDIPIGADTSIGVLFEPVPVTLTVARDGAGRGRVDSSPEGIACGATCSVEVPHGTPLSLTARAELGSTFTGWTGGGCGVANPCSLTLTGDESVRATFAVSRHALTVSVSGDGEGAVRTDLFSCAGGPCVQDYAYGERVSLYADITTGNFAGWGGACASFGTAETCQLVITEDVSVTATFTRSDHTLTAGQEGDGSGSIMSTQGIACVDGAGTCTLTLPEGTMDRLVAVPADGDRFTGWSGACSGTGACNVTVTGPTVVTARFERIRHRLDVSVSDGGAREYRVYTADRAIDCPGRCANELPEGAVTLFSDVPAGYTGVWSEPSCADARECRITLERDTAIGYRLLASETSLLVAVTGDGVGKVGSDEPLFECDSGEVCELEGAEGQVVELRASASAGSVFSRWDGAPGCSSEPTCEVVLGAIGDVKAVFARGDGGICQLSVESTAGATVTSSPAGIECPGVCVSGFPCGEPVDLRASVPSRWEGCEPSPDGFACTVEFTEGTASVVVGRP